MKYVHNDNYLSVSWKISICFADLYITSVMVSGVKESPRIMEDGREPGLEEADRDCGRDAGLEPCCERGIFAF